jgi:hypothetical protein
MDKAGRVHKPTCPGGLFFKKLFGFFNDFGRREAEFSKRIWRRRSAKTIKTNQIALSPTNLSQPKEEPASTPSRALI